MVCMDANEHIYDKAIRKTLTKADGLGMKPAISTFTGEKNRSSILQRHQASRRSMAHSRCDRERCLCDA